MLLSLFAPALSTQSALTVALIATMVVVVRISPQPVPKLVLYALVSVLVMLAGGLTFKALMESLYGA